MEAKFIFLIFFHFYMMTCYVVLRNTHKNKTDTLNGNHENLRLKQSYTAALQTLQQTIFGIKL